VVKPDSPNLSGAITAVSINRAERMVIHLKKRIMISDEMVIAVPGSAGIYTKKHKVACSEIVVLIVFERKGRQSYRWV
jgi:hypothetical protein